MARVLEYELDDGGVRYDLEVEYVVDPGRKASMWNPGEGPEAHVRDVRIRSLTIETECGRPERDAKLTGFKMDESSTVNLRAYLIHQLNNSEHFQGLAT